MSARNLTTSLRRARRPQPRPMERYDRLPPELRRWLAGAALPWSPHSALRLWTRLLREARGDGAAALSGLDRAERRMIEKDCARIWGAAYPPCGPLRPRRGAGFRDDPPRPAG